MICFGYQKVAPETPRLRRPDKVALHLRRDPRDLKLKIENRIFEKSGREMSPRDVASR